MKPFIGLICFLGLVCIPIRSLAQTYAVPTPVDYGQKIQQLQQELNQIELQNDMAQGQAKQVQKPVISLSGGSFEQDFESNNNSWSMLQGQTLRLRFLATPSDQLTGHLDLELWGNVASDLTQFNDLSTLASEGQFFAIREMDATFDAGDLTFTAFKGMSFGGYKMLKDDLYSLFPDEYDVDKPFRISGIAVPEGMVIKGKNDLDGLEIWAGPELQWGVSPEVYFMYQHKLGPTTLGVIERLQFTSLSQPNVFVQAVTTGLDNNAAPGVAVTALYNNSGAVTNTTELYWKIPIGDALVIDNVLLYSPFFINAPYSYVKSVAAGTGTGGSGYQVYLANATQMDALGYQMKLTSTSIPLVDSVMLNGEYSGVLAGDLERISGEITKTPVTDLLFTFDFTVQQPIIGPNPQLLYGSSPSQAPFLTPRGQGSPFLVSLNPVSGINNREMTQFSLSMVFNQGNGWFFRYNPNIFGGYNINTDMDTDFSTGVIGTLFDYQGGTDQFYYNNGAGVLTWETGGLGQAPTDGYAPYVQSWTMWRTGGIHWILDLEGGFSQSALSYNDVAGTPYTNSFTGNLTARINHTSLTIGYGTNNWGPEDWDRQFGIIIGQSYLAQITQTFDSSSVSVKYVRWDNLPGDSEAGGTNGSGEVYAAANAFPLDELYATYTLNF